MKGPSQNKCGLSKFDGAVLVHGKRVGVHFQKLHNTSVVASGKSFKTKMCSIVCNSYSSVMHNSSGGVC